MRDALRAMAEAGIIRARFRARFSGVSPRGYSILNNVMPPVGCIDHCWVKQAFKAEPGSTVSFLATIRRYEHDSGEPDFTLADIQVIG